MSIRKGGEPVGTTSTNNGFTPIQTAVLSLLQTATTSIGFSVSSICKQLKQFSENDIQLVDTFFLKWISFFCFFFEDKLWIFSRAKDTSIQLQMMNIFELQANFVLY